MNKILDDTPPNVVGEHEKERRLYYRLLPILPWNLQPHWHNLLIPSRSNDDDLVPPRRGVQEGFLLNYQDQVNSHLKNSIRRRANVVGIKEVKGKGTSAKQTVSNEKGRNRYPDPCSHCKRKGHPSSKCFDHSDPEIRAKNIAESKYCLLCRGGGHPTPACPTYPPPISPVSGGCLTCKNDKILALHPTEHCRGVAESFLTYLANKKGETQKNGE